MSVATPTVQRHTHASGLHAVAAALDDLHRRALRAAGAESTQVRLSVLNIIAACNDPVLVEGAIDTAVMVAERHPARAIVISADHNRPQMIESDILLRQSPQGSYVELVRIDIGGAPALHLTSIVQPLLIPDIPVHLWIVGAPPLDQAFRPDSVALVDQIVLDSEAYSDPHGTLCLIREHVNTYETALHVGDMAWERLRPWREAIAHAFAGPAMRAWLRRITGVDMISAGASSSTQALLLTGWLESRLSWPSAGGPDVVLREVPAKGNRAGELEHVRIRCADGRHTARIDVERRGGILCTSIDVDAGMVASSMTLSPQEPDGLLIARLLAEGEDDDVYAQAVVRAAIAKTDE